MENIGKLGYGSKCFPKDMSALSVFASDQNVNCTVIDSVVSSNKKIRSLSV